VVTNAIILVSGMERELEMELIKRNIEADMMDILTASIAGQETPLICISTLLFKAI
jgi:hypothetical protein